MDKITIKLETLEYIYTDSYTHNTYLTLSQRERERIHVCVREYLQK